MKVAVVFLFVLAVSSGEETKEKRAAVAYTTPKNYKGEGQVAYATAKVSPQTFPSQQYQSVKYITPQQAAPVAYQQPIDYEQAYQGQQQTVTKLAPSKVAYAAQQAAPVQTHYSLASDVSSFSYNSPIVKYTNQGVLSQTIGQYAQPEKQVEYAAATQQAAPQVQYATQKVTYAPQQQQQKVAYTTAPQQQYTYVQQQPQAQKFAYAALPQKVAYVQQAAPQQQQQQVQYAKVAQPQQQVAYVAAGQKQAYQLIPQSQLQAYLAQAQQQQPQQQQQYVYAQAPQGYEKAYQAAQTQQQTAYAVPQQQQQYYSAKAPSAGGVRYA